jgi:hypothetical protein
LVEQYFSSGKTIDDGFAAAAGNLCNEQLELSQKLKSTEEPK